MREIEEADELNWDEFYMLFLRMRAPIAHGETNQMFLSPQSHGCARVHTHQVMRG